MDENQQRDFDEKPDRPRSQHVLDPEWLSEAIGNIYDCALAPEKWPATIEAIAHHFSLYSAMLGVVRSDPGGAHQLLVHYNFDDEWIAAENEYLEDMFALWGGRERVGAFPLDEPIISSEITPRSRYPENRYYREVTGPRGLHDGAVITLARDGTLHGYFGLTRHVSAGDFSPDERQGLRLLAPHIRRAVTIGDLFEMKAVERLTFHSVLENMRHAVLLLDETAGIVHANKAANALLAERSEIEAPRGKLKLGSEVAQRALESALRLAAQDEAQLGQRGIGVRATARGEGAPLVLHVMPLQRTAIRRGLAQRAVAAAFIVPGDEPADPPLEAVAMIYDLTPAETQIFAAIARGKTIAKAAFELSVSYATARTHLLHVFEKTGRKRQAELVALANSLARPL